MGLFDMIKDTVQSLADMGQLTKMQEQLTAAVTKLHDQGTCPDEVWQALQKLNKTGEEVKGQGGEAAGKAMEALHGFVTTLEANEDKLPEQLKAEIEKMGKTVDGVEGLTKKFLQ